MKKPRDVFDEQRVLNSLHIAMNVFPNQRVCQLIVNATGRNDPFYVEDEQLAEKLDAYVREQGGH